MIFLNQKLKKATKCRQILNEDDFIEEEIESSEEESESEESCSELSEKSDS